MKFVYDLKLKRPGCVLLQAAYGADSRLADRFDANEWLVAPTPDLKVYDITEEQFEE